MKNNIRCIEFEKNTLTAIVLYRSGAVRWYSKNEYPDTVKNAFRAYRKGIATGYRSIITRPFVTGSGTAADPYQYTDCEFLRIVFD
jgi:hypothetical protein